MTRGLLFAILLIVPVQAGDGLGAIDVLLKQGKYADAEKASRAELSRVEERAGPESAAVAHVLNRLNEALLRQGRSDEEVERLIARAVMLEERFEPGTEALAAALGNEGWLFETRGDVASAKPRYARALDVLRQALGPEAPPTLMMQKDLAVAHNALGEYATGRQLLEDALAVRVKQDPAHVDVSVLRHNLGQVYWQVGEYLAAREAFTSASAGFATGLGPGHPHVASSLEGLAVVQVALGQYADALATYRRAFAIRGQVLPPGHPLVGQTLINIGDVQMAMGNYAAARQSLERGLAIWEKSLGPNHPQLVVALTNIAVLRQRTADRAGARRAFSRAIAVRERANGPNDPDLIIPLTELAKLEAEMGRGAAARALYDRAIALGVRTRGSDHPYVATARLEQGLHLAATGDLAGASPLIAEARAIRELALGSDHPDLATAIDASARIAAAEGRDASALDEALRAEAVARRDFRRTAAALPAAQGLMYAEGRSRSQDLAIRTAVRGRADAKTVERLWDTVVRSRALLLDELAFRRHVAGRAASDAAARERLDRLAAARARLAQLFLRGPAGEPSAYRAELARARDEEARAEEQLLSGNEDLRREIARQDVGLAEVREALPAGTALVSFTHYADATFTPERGRKAYAAFVLPHRDATPRLIPLGAASSIEQAVAGWSREIRAETTAPALGGSRREGAYRSAAALLRRRVWDPIAPHLRDASRVLIVPDAALHVVDFATLPRGTAAYLVESGGTIAYASAERDLVPRETSPGIGLLAVGAPAFDRAPLTTRPQSGVRSALRSTCVARPGTRFAPLPESGHEVRTVRRLWPESYGEASVLLDARASEASVKAAAPGKRVLHLATHAFVMGGTCVPAASDALATNPLLASGLVLAGAGRGRRPRDGEDGILTAEEISALDLEGVQWAVLSACDSGLGVSRGGEGVFGLRRAFQIAGVRTVIMSLWPVEDRLARSWMESMYRARFLDGASTADAVRAADRKALAARRRAGESTHPFYWSGFVAAGDWR